MLFVTALTGFLTGAGLIMAIGAQNAFVLRQGLRREHVGLVVTVCMLSDILLIIGGVAGVGAVVREWPGMLQLLRLGGAAFLFIYGLMAAIRACKAAGALAPASDINSDRRRVLAAALAFTFLNPHVYLDTMVLIGSLSTRYTGMAQWAFAGGACVASISWFSTLGYGARLLLPVFKDPRAWRVLDGLIAAFMLMLCLVLLRAPLE